MENKETGLQQFSNFVIFQTTDGKVNIDVFFKDDTVWLTQKALSVLFEKDRSVITKHLKNIFETGELKEEVVCANFAHTTQHGAITGKTQESSSKFYNLDVVISVGYRVKSKRGTQFRQWATQRLKSYLIQGYTINKKRLDELGKIVSLIEQSGTTEILQLNEAKGLLEILSHYTKSFVLLNHYDSSSLASGKLNENITYEIQYDEAKTAISA